MRVRYVGVATVTQARPAPSRHPRTRLAARLDDVRLVVDEHPVARIAACALWIGCLVITKGFVQLTAEVHRNGPHLGTGPALPSRWAIRPGWSGVLLAVLLTVALGGEFRL